MITAAAHSHPLSCHNLGIMYERGHPGIVEKDMVQAMKMYSIAAERRFPESQYALACLLKNVMCEMDSAVEVRSGVVGGGEDEELFILIQ